MAATTVDKSLSSSDTVPQAVACVKMTKGGALQGFTFGGLSIFTSDPTVGTPTALSEATRNFTITAPNGATHTLYITAAVAASQPALTYAASQTGTDGIPTAPWNEWQGSGMTSLVSAGKALYIAFTFDGGDGAAAFARDADIVLYARAIVTISQSILKVLYGKITINTTGDVTFTWM